MNVLTLTKMELVNYLGINELRFTKDPAKKKNKGFMLGTIIFLFVVLAGYVTGQAVAFSMLGITKYIPVVYFALAFMASLAFGIYKAKAVIFREKDLDLMSALPVSGVSIVTSRVIRMYVDNLLLSIGILVPAMVTFAVKTGSGIGVYISILPLCIILPILPSAIAAWVGIIFAAIIARNRHKVLTEVILAMVIVIGSFAISGVISTKAGLGTPGAVAHKNEINAEIKAEMTAMITEKMSSVEEAFPLVKVFEDVLNNADFVGILIYGLISLVVLGITVYVIGKNFFGISKKLFSTQVHREYVMEGLKKKSIMTALVKKEAARYFSSGIYVSNTIIGLVLGVVFSVALGFIDIEKLISTAGDIPIELNSDAAIGFIIAMAFGMMSISASSVSMEGKNWWIVRSLPLSSKDILGAKLLFNLIVAAPFYAISEIILLFTVKASFLERVWIIIIPALAIIFSVLLGLFLNLKFPKFNWEKEMDVVKQSAAVGLSLVGDLLIVIFTGVAIIAPPSFTLFVDIGFAVTVIVISILLYRGINNVKLESL